MAIMVRINLNLIVSNIFAIGIGWPTACDDVNASFSDPIAFGVFIFVT